MKSNFLEKSSDQLNFERLRQKMTPEQWEEYKKKHMTPEQIEAYKKWKIRERQVYLKRKATEAAAAKDVSVHILNKPDNKAGSARKHSVHNEITESPIKKPKLSSDSNQLLLNNHDVPKIHSVKQNSDQNKKLDPNKLHSNNTQTLHMHTNHNRLNSKTDDLSATNKSPPPPPPPPIAAVVLPTPPTTKTLTPTKTSNHYKNNRAIIDGRLQHLSPPPPPPVLKFLSQ